MFSFVLTLFVSLFIADVCSNLITVKTFSNTASFSGVNAYNIYAISLQKCATKTTALEAASNMQKQGGAGYIINKDNSFFVIASAYCEINDANLVKTNLESSNYKPEIITLKIDPISFSSNYSTTETNALSSALKIYKTTFDNLYDISVALDTNVSGEVESKLFVADIANLASKTKLNFEATFPSLENSSLLYLKLSLTELCQKLEELKNGTGDANQTYSSKIKYKYMEIIDLNLELNNNF